MSETRFLRITRTGKPAGFATLPEALAAAGEGGFLWLDYCCPTREELAPLVEAFDLHPLAIEDCTDENQVPKMDEYPRNTFLIFNTYAYSGGELSIGEVDIFIGENFLVTVGGRDAAGRPLLEGVDRVVEREIDTARKGPGYLMHVIVDLIVDRKFTAIDALEEDLNVAEETILADVSGFDAAMLLGLRRSLLGLRKSLAYERETLVKICRRDCPFVPEKAIFAYRDISDHLTRFLEWTEMHREIVTSLMEMYLSMLNNEMAKAANDMNATVRRLTFITTIFMPLTLLAGILGMSEWTMMTGPARWKVAYPLFLAGMVVIGVINYYILRGLETKGAGRRRRRR